MKAYKKIISFILTLVMMLSLSVNVFAAEPLTDDPNMIPTDKSDEMYIIPEIILINNSLCVLTQDNGKGWELTDKDNIVISFDKYKSDITVSQDLIIGYVKDGIMYEGEVFDELSGKYSFSPDEKGEYFFYLLSGSSDYLSLKSGNLEVN